MRIHIFIQIRLLLCKNISVPNMMYELFPSTRQVFPLRVVMGENNTIIIYDKTTLLSLNTNYYNQRRSLYN